MAQQQPTRRKMQSSTKSVSIPDKLYFRIGDVATLCDLPAYVLRFWETEFPQLKPNKGGTGQRLYRKRDVEMVLEIKGLLYEDGFTIAGARRSLAEKRRNLSTEPGTKAVTATPQKRTARTVASSQQSDKPTAGKPKIAERPKIKELRQEMRDLLALLGSDHTETKSSIDPAKRDKKKTRRTSEGPTLFE